MIYGVGHKNLKAVVKLEGVTLTGYKESGLEMSLLLCRL